MPRISSIHLPFRYYTSVRQTDTNTQQQLTPRYLLALRCTVKIHTPVIIIKIKHATMAADGVCHSLSDVFTTQILSYKY